MTVFGSIFLGLSAFVLIGSIFVGVFVRRAYTKRCDIDSKAGFTVSPFWIFLIGFFIAATLMFFPLYYFDYFADARGAVRGFNAFIISAHNTMRMLVLDGEFDIVKNVTSGDGVNAALGEVYQIYAALLFIIAPVLSAGFVLQFFKSASAFFKYCAHLPADVYVLSELNEKSLALAHDIMQNGDGKRMIVFTDVFERNEEREYELITRAKRLGAICLKRDVTAIGFKQHRGDVLRKIYLIGEDEDENVRQAITVIEKCRNSPRYNTRKTEIYVFARSAESEILLNSVDNGELKVRRINENRNLVVHTLCNHSVYAHAQAALSAAAQRASKPKRGGKVEIPLNIAVVGCGGYGTELVKALCVMGQMPDYSLTVHIFDKGDARKALYAAAPELVETSGVRADGEPYYDLKFYDDTDVESQAFLQKLDKLDGITTAFVTLGDDELNIDTAIRMRRQFGRANIARGANVPPIFAVVYSTAKSRTVGARGLLNERNADYGITLIGDMRTRFSLENIERKNLERLGERYHTQYAFAAYSTAYERVLAEIAELERKRDAGRISAAEAERRISACNAELSAASATLEAERARYNKFEYFRRSSIIRAVFYEYRWALGYVPRNERARDDSAEEKARAADAARYNAMLTDYEHRRWSANARADGYVYADVRDDLAKTHDKLVPTSKLTDGDRAKDAVVKIEHDFKIICDCQYSQSNQIQ